MMLNLFTKKSFSLDEIYQGHHRITYRGLPALKCPFDYVLYQMIIHEVRPDLIIEIGTRKGGSALYLADLLQLQGNGIVHTIDLPENEEDERIRRHPAIEIFKTGYQGYPIDRLASYKTILVIDDGSHQYEDTLLTLGQFAPFVTKGSYFIVEDGIINALGWSKNYNGGPERAIREFLQTSDGFVIDRKWCDFFGANATFNTNGYLKRI